MADRVVRGSGVYRTVLLLPYAIAPAIAGVLWMFLFNPSIGIVAAALRAVGIDWNYLLNGGQAMLLVILAAAWKQVSYNFLFFLAGLQAIPASLVEAAAIDGAGRSAASGRSSSAAGADQLLPARRQHRLCLLRHVRGDPQRDPGRPGKGDRNPRLQGLVRRRRRLDLGGSAAQSVVLMAAGDCADRDPVPLCRAPRALRVTARRWRW